MSGNRILDWALNSLKVSAMDEKRANTFKVNKESVEKLYEGLETRTKNMGVKPSINGDADSQKSAPMAVANSFTINTAAIPLPEKLKPYGSNIRELIRLLCRRADIRFNDIDEAIFTAMVPALAGQFNKNDATCTDVTQSEFVPVYSSPNAILRSMVASFPISGDAPMLIDHLLVEFGSLPCIGRQSTDARNKAYLATEIPNQIAAEIAEKNPKQFEQLQKSACLVVQVSYEFQPHHQVLESFNNRRAKGGEESFTNESAFGVSSYSVVSAGTNVRDNSHKIFEDGTRRIRNIYVYLISPSVVNTHEQVLTEAEVYNVVQMMEARAEELSKLYAPYRVFRYDDLIRELNEPLRDLHVTTTSDIFEHSLLKVAGIQKEPTKCFIDRDGLDYINIELQGLLNTDVQQFVDRLNAVHAKPEQPICIRKPNNHVRLNLSAFSNSLLAATKAAALEILKDPRALKGYQHHSNHHDGVRLYKDAIRKMCDYLTSQNISVIKTPAAEVVITRMFNCNEFFTRSEIRNGKGYIASMTDANFYINISAAAAKKIVENINRKFPYTYPLARFVSADAKFEETDQDTLCLIALDKELFLRNDFVAEFKETFDAINENEPQRIDEFRELSGQRSMADIQNTLTEASKKFEAKGNIDIAASLALLNKIITSKSATMTNRLDAAFSVKQACRLWKTEHNRSEVLRFKNEEGKEIKSLLSEVRLK